MRRKIFLISLIYILSFTATNSARSQVRVTIPSFPSCANPQGETRVVYMSGIHGIPGDTNTYTGSDTVYNLTEETITQCFCSENGDGIQTNWWKVSSLSFDEIEYLQALGWTYIPNGAEWGLSEAPYMAQNIQYNCGNPGPKDRTVSDRDKNRGGRGGPGGEILASATSYGFGGQILGLASTGNIDMLLLVLGTATLSLTSAVLLLNKKHDK